MHGDYRLDNVLVVGEGIGRTISAILDWEMATLGDPLVDLGIFALYWDISRILGPLAGGLGSAVDPTAGYPRFDELLDAYAERAGIAVPTSAGTGLRRVQAGGDRGGNPRPLPRRGNRRRGFERMGDLVEPLARHGLERHGPDPEKEATDGLRTRRSHRRADRPRSGVRQRARDPSRAGAGRQLAAAPNEWRRAADGRSSCGQQARGQGLWNLFLPGERGAGLTNLQYAPIAEVTGWSLRLAPVAFNCSAPDTGNMEVINDFGTAEQKQRGWSRCWTAEIRSAFCMTEPDVASSDATNIATRSVATATQYVINGRKWWSTGAMNPDAAIFIVMGKTDPTAPRHRQQSMILVPRDTPGVSGRPPADRVRLRRPSIMVAMRRSSSTTSGCRPRT